jgi:flagellar biogenesis protein FliO
VRIGLLFLIFILSSCILSAKVLSHKVEQKQNGFNITFIFDDTYLENLQQTAYKDKIVIVLPDISYLPKSKTNLKNPKLDFKKEADGLHVIVSSKSKIEIEASKSENKKILKIEVVLNSSINSQTQQNRFEAGGTSISYRLYLISFAFIALLIAVLYFIKKKLKESYIIGGYSDINIISQKSIDMKNRVVLMEYDDTKYLFVVNQNGGFLLNKIEESEES